MTSGGSSQKRFGSPASQGERRLAQVAAADTYVRKADLLIGSGRRRITWRSGDLLERSFRHIVIFQIRKSAWLNCTSGCCLFNPAHSISPDDGVGSGQRNGHRRAAISRVRGKDLPLALLGTALDRAATRARDATEAGDREHEVRAAYGWSAEGHRRVIWQDRGKDSIGIFVERGATRSVNKACDEIELNLWRNLSANAIAAARAQIVLEHPVSQRDWDPLVTDNPFIPPGRERIFAEGLHAGLTGNLLVAVHLLCLSLRIRFARYLPAAGAITSKLNNEGIQEEKHIQELLYMPEFEQLSVRRSPST